jgi:hypothetical protein
MVYAAEFFGQRLTQVELSNGTTSGYTIIDSSEGPMYSVRVADGGTTLYADNYLHTGSGSIWKYSKGNDGKFVKSLVGSGFVNRQHQQGSGAPGWLFPHAPAPVLCPLNISLAICGDGAETFTVLKHTSSSSSWSLAYSEDYKSTVGSASLGDWDGDGYTDIVVTDYDKGLLHVYSYKK